jgi:isopentenyl-diphosphate delta-isomerase
MSHEARKADHIRINLDEDVQNPSITTGFERYALIHRALPEHDLRAIDTSVSQFGKRLALPLIISSMTGGTEAAAVINRHLAVAAQARGVAMGLGSQRAALESAELAGSFRVRSYAPDILLFANLGAVQLNYGYGVEECRRAVDMVEADALILHLNPLQEALQSDGNWNWSGLLVRIGEIVRRLGAPVVVKEVGWGIDSATAAQLASVGVAAIDVAGAGGTSWSAVEGHRAASDRLRRLAGAFGGWGIPTAESLRLAAMGAPGVPLYASGGVRCGVDVAKALALGASLAGVASPFLKAAADSADRVVEAVDSIASELRISMFSTGAGSVRELQAGDRIARVIAGEWTPL